MDNISHWSHRLLTERGVDQRALTDWCSLYSATPFRKSQALAIIHKVLKKESGGYAVRKPSAFIVTSVKEAWHKVPVQITAGPDGRIAGGVDGGGSGSWDSASRDSGGRGSAWWGDDGWSKGGWGGWGW